MTHGSSLRMPAVAGAVATLLAVAARASAATLRQVDDDLWQVSIDPAGQALRLVVRDRASGRVVADNDHFLPRTLDQAGSDWSVSAFQLSAGQFTVAMRLHPSPGTGNRQDKRFSFDLRQPGLPLVAFESEVVRDGRTDVQHFDLVKGQSSRCLTSAASPAKACEPQVEPFDTTALVPLARVGPAESYVPPIPMQVVY